MGRVNSLLRLISLAFRNTSRNRKRTIITALAVAVGVFVVITAKGLLNGLESNLVGQITQGLTGQIQVHDRQYALAGDARPLKYAMNYRRVVRTITSVEGIESATGRIGFSGMLSTGETTVNCMFYGVDPNSESTVCPAVNAVESGEPFPSDMQVPGVLLSRKLADDLGIGLGHTLTIVATTKYGGMNAIDVEVFGILPTSNLPQANKLAYIDLTSAQSLLQMPGQVTEFAIRAGDKPSQHQLSGAKSSLIAELGSKYTVRTWDEITTFLNDSLAMLSSVLTLLTVILFIIVITGVINTMLMTVLERTKEIGTMMALGVKRRQIVSLFLSESAIIGLIGVAAGILPALLLITLASRHGIRIGPATATGEPLRPFISFWFAGLAVMVAMTGAVASAWFPARRAANLRPAEALRK